MSIDSLSIRGAMLLASSVHQLEYSIVKRNLKSRGSKELLHVVVHVKIHTGSIARRIPLLHSFLLSTCSAVSWLGVSFKPPPSASSTPHCLALPVQ